MLSNSFTNSEEYVISFIFLWSMLIFLSKPFLK
nr:MAG TPA: hypothetical protein [Caudoviricetes sp.]